MSRRYNFRPGSGEKAGTVFTTDATFYDPVDSLFIQNDGPCTKKKPILLQGPWAQDFKDFLEKRAVERAKKKSSGCDSIWSSSNDEECGWWRSDTSGDWLDFFVLSEDKVKSLCAAVLWPDGAQRGTYTIDINRTIGYMNDKGQFYPGWSTKQDHLFVEPKCSDPGTCKNFIRNFWEPSAGTKCIQPECYPSSHGLYSSYDQSVKTELQVLLTQFAQWGGKASLGFPYLSPKAEDSDLEIPLSISVMDFPRRITDSSGSNSYSMAPLGFYLLGTFISWIFVGWILANVGRLVREREEKRKEGLRMIGCTNTAYYLHWLLYGALVSFVYSVLVTAIFLFFQVIVHVEQMLVLFLCAILFFLDITMVSFVFSCFFSAALMGQLISLVQYIFLCSMSILPNGSTLLLFLPTVGWSKMMGRLVYESAYDTSEGFKGPEYGVILLFLLVDFFLYLGLWLYFDQVISHNGSNTLSYFFPCSPDYWKGEDGIVRDDPSPGTEMREMRLSRQEEPPTNAPESEGRSSNALLGSAEAAVTGPRRSIDELMSRQGRNSLIEPVDQTLMAKALAKECVTINGLCVYFRGVHGEEIKAVDGVDLAMYPGEIFALLGHNGAGKSTTMSALSGLVRSSKGSIDVFGSKVPEDLVTIRKTMGFCPQHDVLFPDMTVAQHFQLFCAVAGRSAINDAELMELATAVGLARRAGFGVTALSGGMKRKLSVGLAFAGEPKLVILDEPTSGMDPYSRRGLWDFLKERREGRVLLLTTHFMDEAEVLGDRVAIMRAGQVQACGTPSFLKRRFGCGYVLTVVMQQRGDPHEPVKELLLGALSSGIQISGVGKEILVNVPLEKESSLAGCLSQLSAHREALNIATFGVSVTNLEEVFLKVASGNTASKGHADEVEESFKAASIGQDQTDTGPAFVMPNPGGTVTQQLLALFLRRGRTAIRDTKAFMVGCLLPVIIIFLAAMFGRAILRGGDPPPAMQPVSMVDMGKSLNVLYAVSAPRPDGEQLPDGVVVIPDEPPRGIDESGNFRCDEMYSSSSDCNFVQKARAFEKYTPWGYLSHCMSGKLTRKQECLERFLSFGLSFAEMLVNKAEKGNPQDLGVLLVDGFPLVTVDKKRVPNSIPIAFNELFNKVGEPADVEPTYKIMEMTRPQAEYYTQSGFFLQLGAGLLTCVLSNFGFSFIPIAVLGFVLMEKNKEVKHQLLISGCAARAYWLSMLMWDFMVALLPIMALFFFLWMVGMDAYTTYWQETIILLLLFTPAAVGIAYVLSHVTSSPIAGNIFLSVCNGICVVFLVIIFLLLDILLKVLPLTAVFTLDPKTADIQDLQDVKDAAQGNCDNLDPNGFLAVECLWAHRAKLWGPVVALSGYVLPSFGLLDGLLRISLRHNLVKVGIPTVVEMAGEHAGSFVVNTAWSAVFQGCGKPQTPLSATASCSQYRAEDRTDSCMIDQMLGGFQGMVTGVIAPQLAFIFDQMEIVVSDNVPQQSREAIIRALDEQKARILAGFSGGTNMMEQMLLGSALQWVPDEDRAAWEKYAMCSTELNQTSTAIASIAKAFGDNNVGNKIRDWFADLAKSKGLRDSADRMLPPLGTSWNKCTMGPELGPWALSKLLGIPTETLEQLDGLSLGPVYVKIPCDLGLKGPAGDLIKTFVVMPTVGRAQLQLALLCFLFPFVAILMEDISQSPKFAKWAVNKTPVPPELLQLEDDDVKAEKERVANVDPRRQIMYVRGLRKAYGSRFSSTTTHAVRGVTWASDSGMVFGLLGVNGAGKTTSFKMMSGILTPSDGEVRILGIDIVEETARARRLIGYCPQFDALIDMLTVQDHLYMYARVKGLAGTDLTHAVNEKIAEMQLEQYRDRRAGTLSGGNKRKLSVAMAIIGEPPVIFLDEPSTGMDPFARRFMWSVIQDVAEKRKQSVVVLTTHSMEEAEALCSSIAIQVDGQLRCLGSAQALKSKYGQGYEVAVKFATPPSEVMQQTLQELLPEGHNSPTDIIPRGVVLQALPAEARADAQEASGCIPPGKGEIQAVVVAEWLVMRGKLHGLLEFLQTELQLNDVSVQEFHSSSARIRLGSVGDSDLPGLFGAFSESRGRLGLSDFSVCQASLEQIFNSFAANAGAAPAPS